MVTKIIFIIFFFYLLISLCQSHIPLVEAIFKSLGIIYLNGRFLLISVLQGFLASFKDVGYCESMAHGDRKLP